MLDDPSAWDLSCVDFAYSPNVLLGFLGVDFVSGNVHLAASVFKVVTKFNKGQIVMARWLHREISQEH